MTTMHIGEAVRKRRKALKLTLQQTVDRMDVEFDTGNLSRAERGEQRFTTRSLESVAQALHTSVQALYQGVDNPPDADADNASDRTTIPDETILRSQDIKTLLSKVPDSDIEDIARQIFAAVSPESRRLLLIDLLQAELDDVR